MSDEKTAAVVLTDPHDLNAMANNINGMKEGYTTSIMIDDVIIEGWVLTDTKPPFFRGDYHLVLRHPLDNEANTAEYVGILLSDDGYVMDVSQIVLTQNDGEFHDAGFERFDALWSVPAH